MLSSILTTLVSILALVLILSIIIVVHEFGHFIWAKHFGVHIYEFSIGMGPIIKTHKGKDGIDYNFRAFPIGGFVAMAGEVYDDDDKIDKKKLMCNKPWLQRLIILVAGVVNNFILAIIVLFVSGLIWGCAYNTNEISEVLKDSAMDKAGIVAGDKILSVNDKKITSWEKAQMLLIFKDKDNIYDIEIEHQNKDVELYHIKPEVTKDKKGNERNTFGFKVGMKEENGFIASLKYSVKKFGSIVESMWLTIYGLFSNKVSLNALSGPVGMYEVVNQGLSEGINYLVYILALLSINVGFLNILPFPAFDGGRVLFMIIEKIKRSPVNAKIENQFHTVGFILLMILMIYITIKDVINLF